MDIHQTLKEVRNMVLQNKWSANDDHLLISTVEKKGPKNWKEIALSVPGKSAKQCRYRWSVYLSPTLNHNPWKPHEDEIIWTSYKEVGPRWKFISNRLEGRSPEKVKERYQKISSQIRRHRKNQMKNCLNDSENSVKFPVTETKEEFAQAIEEEMPMFCGEDFFFFAELEI
ncbi:Myb-like DNA-binding domain containing protein [Tritrichomonas foetus]|uniref:Myb-like DNA-binding domain containing protein n=1 Tax=Tritrichomonas foetus TaxID=1144522 RepID=A0A1J4JM19_9EUKA|nr:Myb-like DNA-binding domain containing protein [Tritrichomonas foetus]|eukprot:OHS98603.1 Myb-like DNA-binding domain containing protein [Tritrichomonas foetus]